jgi:hypothetical protein
MTNPLPLSLQIINCAALHVKNAFETQFKYLTLNMYDTKEVKSLMLHTPPSLSFFLFFYPQIYNITNFAVFVFPL